MIKIVFLSWMFFFGLAGAARAQYFNNINQELCFELYTRRDALSEFRVYIVIDRESFTKQDSITLTKWKSFSYFRKQEIVRRWANEGRRIEADRAPFVRYPPVFPTVRKFPVLQEVNKEKIDWEKSPWAKDKKGWAYPDRPF